MSKLSTGKFLYLLYAYSYCLEEKTVTKSTVKKAMSTKVKDNPDQIYDALLKDNLIESPPKSKRFLVTDKGINSLIKSFNQEDINYKFSTKNSQHKILNTLLKCCKLAIDYKQIETIDFDTFVDKFEQYYFQKKKRQELSGAVAIRKQEIYQEFMDNSLSISTAGWNQYFDKLKSIGKVFTSKGEEDELVHWVE